MLKYYTELRESLSVSHLIVDIDTTVLEDFLYTWIHEVKFDNEHFASLTEAFGGMFKYTGKLYRGIATEEGHAVPPQRNHYLICTDYKPVALHHANYRPQSNEMSEVDSKRYDEKNIKGCDSYLMTLDVEGAFAFDAFLVYIRPYLKAKQIKDIVETFLWENEKWVLDFDPTKCTIEKLNKEGTMNKNEISTNPLA